MVETRVDAATFWTERLALVTADDRADIRRIIAEAEPRRARAKFNTGSITETSALALRGVCRWAQAKWVIEVGTFIGVSTLSMGVPWIDTCDVSNDCLPSWEYGRTEVRAFPYQTSTQMLRFLLANRMDRADLFFFDGLLSSDDMSMIQALSHKRTVYVFDDYNGQFKGVQNVAKLQPVLPNHVLIPAAGLVKDDTTLAVLVQESRL